MVNSLSSSILQNSPRLQVYSEDMGSSDVSTLFGAKACAAATIWLKFAKMAKTAKKENAENVNQCFCFCLCLCLCMCEYLCLCQCLCLCLCLCACVCACICVCACVCVSMCLCVGICVCVSVCVCFVSVFGLCQCLYPSVSVPVSVSVSVMCLCLSLSLTMLFLRVYQTDAAKQIAQPMKKYEKVISSWCVFQTSFQFSFCQYLFYLDF